MDKAAHLQAIMTAGRRIHEAVDTIDVIVSQRLGVHRSDLVCLYLLEKGPATPRQVAARTGLTSGSVTALLDRLEGAGFVERRRSCADRRSVELAMPAARRLAIQMVMNEVQQGLRHFFESRPVAEVAMTGIALGTFADALVQFSERFEHQWACSRNEPPV